MVTEVSDEVWVSVRSVCGAAHVVRRTKRIGLSEISWSDTAKHSINTLVPVRDVTAQYSWTRFRDAPLLLLHRALKEGGRRGEDTIDDGLGDAMANDVHEASVLRGGQDLVHDRIPVR